MSLVNLKNVFLLMFLGMAVACTATEQPNEPTDAADAADASDAADATDAADASDATDAADASDPGPMDNVQITLGLDSYFMDVSYALTDSEGTTLESGLPESQDDIQLSLRMDDGHYCLTITDGFGDGGVSGFIEVDGETVAEWTAVDYGETYEACFAVNTVCKEEVGEDAVRDMCGVCDVDATNDCVEDCAGVWGGTSTVDACDACVADAAEACTPNVTVSFTTD